MTNVRTWRLPTVISTALSIFMLVFLSGCDLLSSGSDLPPVDGPRFDLSSAEAFQESYYRVIEGRSADEVETLRWSFASLASRESIARIRRGETNYVGENPEDRSIGAYFDAIGDGLGGRPTTTFADSVLLVNTMDGVTELALEYGTPAIHGMTYDEYSVYVIGLQLENTTAFLADLNLEDDALEKELLFLNGGRLDVDMSFMDYSADLDKITFSDPALRWETDGESAGDELKPVLSFEIGNGSGFELYRLYCLGKFYADGSETPTTTLEFQAPIRVAISEGKTLQVDFTPRNAESLSDETRLQSSSVRVEVETLYADGTAIMVGQSKVQRMRRMNSPGGGQYTERPRVLSREQQVILRRVEIEETIARYESEMAERRDAQAEILGQAN